MKRLLLTLVAFAALLHFNGCKPSDKAADKPNSPDKAAPRDEKTALAEFKKDITSFNTWHDEKEKSFKDPMDGLTSFGELATKIKAIKTDGLPADLKDPWNSMLGCLDKMAALATQFPKDPAEMAKKMADETFGKEVFGKLKSITEEVKPHIAKLKEAGTKYGVEGIEKIGPK